MFPHNTKPVIGTKYNFFCPKYKSQHPLRKTAHATCIGLKQLPGYSQHSI